MWVRVGCGMQPATSINLLEKFSRFSDQWSPKVIAELNDIQFKLARLEGEFVWHRHDDTDEAFFVVEGTLHMLLRDGEITVPAGSLYVVPKGVEHCPVADSECVVMIIEPRNVVNTGNTGGSRTAPNDVWI